MGKIVTQQVNFDDFIDSVDNGQIILPNVNSQSTQGQLTDGAEISGVKVVVPGDEIDKREQIAIDLQKVAKKKSKKKQATEKKKQKKTRANKTIEASAKSQEIIQQHVEQELRRNQMLGQTNVTSEQIRQQVIDNLDIPQITPDDYENLKDVIEEENNVNLDNVDIPNLASSIGEAMEEIPDASDDITDYEITPVPKRKSREGYTKTKVNIKKEGIPQIINQISTNIRKLSKNLISPRVCDLRVIGNTNKTQLRNSQLKLSVYTVVFKPDSKRQKVNKGTRIMISIPTDYESTGNLLVYLQESRAKTIIEINTKELEHPVDFFATIIAQFYNDGYNVTLKRLQLRGVGNEIMQVINLILANHQYTVKIYSDKDDNHIYCAEIHAKETEKNQFIGVRLLEGDIDGKWKLEAFDKTSSDTWMIGKTNKDVSIKWLESNILNILKHVYVDTDFEELITQGEVAASKNGTPYYDENGNEASEEYIRESTKYDIMLKKLSHRKLVAAFWYLRDLKFKENEPIEILKVLSKADINKLNDKSNNYEAESILGVTDKVKFGLTYLAHQIKAGDKRAGRDYITRDEYYERYNVRDRRKYEKRDNTVIKRQNVERNYNARIYLFKLEYTLKTKNKMYVYYAKTLEELIEKTKFLSENPVMINHEYNEA